MDSFSTKLTEETKQYNISLNALDGVLARYCNPNEPQMLPESNSTSRNVKYKTKYENSEHSAGTYTKHVHCNVCNINIPTQYLQEHFKSNKHITCKKIIDISLNRLKSVMNDMEIFEEMDTSNLVYFCPSCVSTIDINDKGLHEKTMIHKNSLIAEKILNEFLDVHENNDKILKGETGIQINSKINNITEAQCNVSVDYKNNCKEQSSINNSIDPSEVRHIDAETDKIIDTKDKEIVDVNYIITEFIHLLEENLIKTVRDIFKIETFSQENETINNNNTTKDLDVDHLNNTINEYILFLNNKFNCNILKILSDGNLLIRLDSCAKVRIFDMNFVGLLKRSKNIFECLLCSKHIHKKDKWSHLNEKEHMDVVSVPLKNENCIRRIDSVWNHCVICNTRVQFVIEHIADESHKLLVSRALITGSTYEHNIDYNVNTHVKNVNSENAIGDVLVKNNTTIKKKVKKYFCDVCNIDVVNRQETHERGIRHVIYADMKKSGMHYTMRNQCNEYLNCIVCKENVENSEVEVRKHLKNSNHIDKYKRLLTSNDIKVFKKYRYYCNLCDVSFIETKELIHIQDEQHVDNINRRRNEKTNANKNIVTLRKDDGIFDNTFTCTICNITVANDNYNIYTHLRSTIHRRGLNGWNSDELINIHYHIDLVRLPILYCMVCDIELTVNEAYKQHVYRKEHKRKYNNCLSINRITVKGLDYYCNVCSVYVPYAEEVMHCKTTKHTTNLSHRKVVPLNYDTEESIPNAANELVTDNKM